MSGPPVLASGRLIPHPSLPGKWVRREWADNGEMVADVARLWFDLRADRVLDPTYGRGNWWTEVRPRHLFASDLLVGDDDKVRRLDFTDLPYSDGTFDVVAFDPPYVAMGGRETSTVAHTNDRFGMDTAPDTPDGVRELIAAGLREAERVLKPARRGRRPGRLLVKCQDYTSSGHLQPGSDWVIEDASRLGFRYEDRFELVRDPGQQPSHDVCRICDGAGSIDESDGGGVAHETMVECSRCEGHGRIQRTQKHARRNLSSLLVFTRNRKPPTSQQLPLDVA